MTLDTALIGVFLVFCLMMAGVLAFCLVERRKSRSTSHQMTEPTAENVSRNDKRIVYTLVGMMVLGALMALLTGYLVFGRSWG